MGSSLEEGNVLFFLVGRRKNIADPSPSRTVQRQASQSRHYSAMKPATTSPAIRGKTTVYV